MVIRHSEILAKIPAMDEKIDRVLDNQERLFQRSEKTDSRVLVLETQRKTERSLVAFIALIGGTVAGWFGKNL